MARVPLGPSIGLGGQVALLVVLAVSVGLSLSALLIGVACGVITTAALSHGLRSSGAAGLGPADRVTLTRATLVGCVAALVEDSFTRPPAVATMVALAVVALVLDGVDGWVARRTGTESALGARFDMEVDAFLILVLSVYVAASVGLWVLAIGAARYLFVAAGWLLPWLRATLPPRYWRKPVAAIQGIVLTVAVTDVLPGAAISVLIVAASALLAESFGRDVWWLARHSWLARLPGSSPPPASSTLRP